MRIPLYPAQPEVVNEGGQREIERNLGRVDEFV
jgi:hypothetical protein